ncbi:hypothetical protein J6590_018691 [Homalodisca vitripennis]|nr:hypothetical protein J6590_018691 [Homalodisca vitripennis]
MEHCEPTPITSALLHCQPARHHDRERCKDKCMQSWGETLCTKSVDNQWGSLSDRLKSKEVRAHGVLPPAVCCDARYGLGRGRPRLSENFNNFYGGAIAIFDCIFLICKENVDHSPLTAFSENRKKSTNP